MKFKRSISILVLCIIVLSMLASIYGVFSEQGPGKHEFKSLYGETIEIYGKGLYRNDSVSIVSQAKAQDAVTMLLAVPLLIISLYLSRKGLLKGRLLLTGTLGYFLYTYTSYSFLTMYNCMFLIYVFLMSSSLFGFILSMMSFDLERIKLCFKQKLPVKFLGGFFIFFAAALTLMWLGRIAPSLTSETPPSGLEHYSTLIIQAMDLGIVVPAAIISGVLVIKRRPFGYLLSSVITIKGLSMATAVTAMVVNLIIAGIKVSPVEMVVFPLINVLLIYCLVLIMKNVVEPGKSSIKVHSISQ